MVVLVNGLCFLHTYADTTVSPDPILPRQEGLKAFRRISFSWRKSLTSLRSLLRELSETPSSLAILATLLFGEERTRWMASCLNSGGKLGVAPGTLWISFVGASIRNSRLPANRGHVQCRPVTQGVPYIQLGPPT